MFNEDLSFLALATRAAALGGTRTTTNRKINPRTLRVCEINISRLVTLPENLAKFPMSIGLTWHDTMVLPSILMWRVSTAARCEDIGREFSRVIMLLALVHCEFSALNNFRGLLSRRRSSRYQHTRYRSCKTSRGVAGIARVAVMSAHKVRIERLVLSALGRKTSHGSPACSVA